MVTEHDWMELRGIFLVYDLFMETFRCFSSSFRRSLSLMVL